MGYVRVRRKPPADDEKQKNGGGGRFHRAPDFSVPGPFSERPMSADGRVSFHFSRDIVTKAADGGSMITWASGNKQLTSTASAEHDKYVSREDAVMTISAAEFDVYAGREAAVELAGDGRVALFTNIDDDPGVRRDYWLKVHEHERTPNPDAIEFHRSRLPAAAWLRIAEMEMLPPKVREAAFSMAAPAKGKKRNKKKADAELEMERAEAGKLLSAIRDEMESWDWQKPPIRLRKGRGGRTQFRLTAEFPQGIDTASRLRITARFCQELRSIGVMYTAAIHAPDHHNDERNYHLHIAYHDRPAKRMPDGRWDFEIKEKVPNQWNRFRYPHRQPKISELVHDPEGGNWREYQGALIYRMREFFSEICNEELEKVGSDRLFDPRTYRDMGIDQVPTKPLGVRAAALEAVGVPTVNGMLNAETIWTAALQRNIKTCDETASGRADFRARIDAAMLDLEAAGADGLANELREAARRYDGHARFLATHDLEIGEYRITLMMAHARPTKAVDTCSRILDAIEVGRASPSETRDQSLIEDRLHAADAFLDGIDAIEKENATIVESNVEQAKRAQAELADLTAGLEQLLDQDVKAALALPRAAEVPDNFGDRAEPDQPAPVADHDLIAALLDRIAENDTPIFAPDARHDAFHVPGITRVEFRLLSAARFAPWVQSRLAGISKIQHDRMATAATLLRSHGQAGLEHLAATSSNARRALKHLEAYRDHPTLIALTGAPISASQGPASVSIAEVPVALDPDGSKPARDQGANGQTADIEVEGEAPTDVAVTPMAPAIDYEEALRRKKEADDKDRDQAVREWFADFMSAHEGKAWPITFNGDSIVVDVAKLTKELQPIAEAFPDRVAKQVEPKVAELRELMRNQLLGAFRPLVQFQGDTPVYDPMNFSALLQPNLGWLLERDPVVRGYASQAITMFAGRAATQLAQIPASTNTKAAQAMTQRPQVTGLQGQSSGPNASALVGGYSLAEQTFVQKMKNGRGLG